VSLSPSRFIANEPERDLNSEMCLARLEDVLRETTRDLTKEAFSTKPDAEPNEALRYTLRPLKKEPTRVSEALKDLKNELFSTRLEPEPNEALRPLARPLLSKATGDNETDRDLK